MFDKKNFDEMVSSLVNALPASLSNAKEDLKNNFNSILQEAFTHLDLVSREEFDVQVAVLARTRERLEQLEKKIAELEHK